MLPFPVAESPPARSGTKTLGLPQGEACRENFLVALDGLLTNDPNEMSFVVDSACKNAESRNDFSEDYASNLSEGFRDQLIERLVGTGLAPEDIANRAQFAGSCIGCHLEANGRFLGNGVFAPFSNGFVHIQEFPDRLPDRKRLLLPGVSRPEPELPAEPPAGHGTAPSDSDPAEPLRPATAVRVEAAPEALRASVVLLAGPRSVVA